MEMEIGVNTGQVVVGSHRLRLPGQIPRRRLPRQFASRIEVYALGGQVIISAGICKRLKDVVNLGNVFEVEVKGLPDR